MKRCKHHFMLSFGPCWVCKKCGALKKITKKEYEKINTMEYVQPEP